MSAAICKFNRRCKKAAGRWNRPYKSGVEQVIIFARAPRLGEVKTRLAAEVGDAEALEIYRRLLGTLFANLRQLRGVEVAFAPADGARDFAELLPAGWSLKAQNEGTLDMRLIAAFEAAFQSGAGKVAIIGSDCPSVKGGHIRQAFAALGKADVVFGPATDGGYWLVGLKSPQPELFRDISWSTSEVLAQSLGRAKGLGLKIDLLEILSDVDTKADWERFQKEQRSG